MFLVVLAVFGAGFLNAAAGGGSLISFPALVASGLSPLTANVTNTLALWPGYVGGAASQARNLHQGDGDLRRFAVAAGVGAVVGAAALLVFDDGVFDAVVPYLVLFAAGLLAVPDRWLARLRAPSRADRRAGRHPLTLLTMAAGGAYGAYFGGALGVVLLAILSGVVGQALPQANATKNTLSLLINTVALCAFVGLAPVDWPSVAVGAPASLAGALTGSAAATRLDPTWLRRAIVAYALVAGLILLFR